MFHPVVFMFAYQTLFGKTSAPVAITLFSTLKSSWKSLDLSNLRFPTTPASNRSSVDALLGFIDEQLLPENLEHITRRDYKELLELAKVCLGETVERRKCYTYRLNLEQTVMQGGCQSASTS